MAEIPKTTPEPKPATRWLRVVLVLSLGLNILVVGLIGGAMLRKGPPEKIRIERDVAALGLRAYIKALTPEDRRALRRDARAGRDEFQLGRKQFRAHLEALAEALVAEPYDPEAVAEVLRRQSAVVARNISAGQKLLLARIAAMGPEARAEMAKNLLRRGGPKLKRRN